MNAPERPLSDLVDLHRIMLELQQTHQPDDRKRLANLIVDHDGMCPKFNLAIAAVMGHHAQDTHLLQDVQQELREILIERLIVDNLKYEDQGPDRFGGWLLAVCKTNCVAAWVASLPLWAQSIEFPETSQLEAYPARVEVEHRVDKLARAIDSIDDDETKDVMYDDFAGTPLADSARKHEVSTATVSRRRARGAELIRQFFEKE